MKQAASSNIESQLFALSTLVQLVKRARHAAQPQELAFVIVNETHALLPYRQAALWRQGDSGGGKIVAVSGAASVERHAPLVLWLDRVFVTLDKGTESGAAPYTVEAGDLPPALREEWAEWLPAHGLLVPLALGPGRRLGALLLAREKEWSDGERHLMQELADGYAAAWAVFLHRRRFLRLPAWSRGGMAKLAVVAAVLAALFLPISLSALAPADVVPLEPTIVRAPLEGVVDRVRVVPNEPVNEGQALVDLDPRAFENRLEVARQALAVAEAEYRQAAQQAVFDDKSRSQLALLKGRMEQRRAETTYAQSLLERIHVTAGSAGIAIFDDPNDWIGRPVTIGERLMEIADPNRAELEIWLPVADATTLKAGAEVDYFLNVAPDAPLRATVRQASYEASLSPNGLLAYRLKARFAEGTKIPRIGLRGTAKVYGEKVTLFYYLMRRPLAAIRQFVGL